MIEVKKEKKGEVTAGPAANACSCTATAKQVANAVEKRRGIQHGKPSKNLRKLTMKVARIKEEVYQALAVMHKETGKMLKFWQLVTHADPK